MININLDTFLKIGHAHKICEDYIISGMEPIPHIILADGCSSSKNTEMGARLLCYLARQFLTLKDVKNSTYEQMGNWIISNAEMTARQLGLNASSLDSTLVVSYYDQEEDNILIRVYGDAFIISIDKNDKMAICEEKFTKNAPYYLSYRLDPERDEEYHKEKIDLISSTSDIETGSKMNRIWAYDREISFNLQASSYKLILICSDGIGSFYYKSQEADPEMDVEYVVQELSFFRSKAGSFLKRRASKALKLYEKANVFHADDLSIGAYLIQEEDE